MTNKYQRIINGAPADVYDVLDAFGSGTPRNDLSGQTFGKLKPIQYNNGRWACMCDCGNVAFVKTGNLTSGNSSSCGCAKAAARKRKDMKPGDSFGRWTLMSYLGGSRWSCVCQCGTEGTASTSNLRDGKTKSCGCLNDEAITTHDMSHHPLYKTWRGMVARCHVESDKSYKWYGARGISVCDEWRKTFLIL